MLGIPHKSDSENLLSAEIVDFQRGVAVKCQVVDRIADLRRKVEEASTRASISGGGGLLLVRAHCW